jgi:mRNA interferase RelE/StbE
MKTEIRKSFTKDADKLPAAFQQQLGVIIEQIQKAKDLRQIENCKKLKGERTAYRIRLGRYRIGFYYYNGLVELVRVLNRKDIYRYFP